MRPATPKRASRFLAQGGRGFPARLPGFLPPDWLQRTIPHADTSITLRNLCPLPESRCLYGNQAHGRSGHARGARAHPPQDPRAKGGCLMETVNKESGVPAPPTVRKNRLNALSDPPGKSGHRHPRETLSARKGLRTRMGRAVCVRPKAPLRLSPLTLPLSSFPGNGKRTFRSGRFPGLRAGRGAFGQASSVRSSPG